MPVPGQLLVEGVDHLEDVVVVRIRSTVPPRCPVCASSRVSYHSRYERRLRDLPWQGRQVQLCLRTAASAAEMTRAAGRSRLGRYPDGYTPTHSRSGRFAGIGGEADTLLAPLRARPEVARARSAIFFGAGRVVAPQPGKPVDGPEASRGRIPPGVPPSARSAPTGPPVSDHAAMAEGETARGMDARRPFV